MRIPTRKIPSNGLSTTNTYKEFPTSTISKSRRNRYCDQNRDSDLLFVWCTSCPNQARRWSTNGHLFPINTNQDSVRVRNNTNGGPGGVTPSGHPQDGPFHLHPRFPSRNWPPTSGVLSYRDRFLLHRQLERLSICRRREASRTFLRDFFPTTYGELRERHRGHRRTSSCAQVFGMRCRKQLKTSFQRRCAW